MIAHLTSMALLTSVATSSLAGCGGGPRPTPSPTTSPTPLATPSPTPTPPAPDPACLPMPSQPEVCLARRVRFDEACPTGGPCKFDASTFRWAVVPGPQLEDKLAPMRGSADRIVVTLGRDTPRPALVVEYDLAGHVRRRLESGAVQVLPRASGDWLVVEPHRLHLLDTANRVQWEIVPGAPATQAATLLADEADGVIVQLKGAPASEIVAIGNDGFVRWRYVLPAGINLEKAARVGRETLLVGLVVSGEHALLPKGQVFRRPAQGDTLIQIVIDDRGRLTRAEPRTGDARPSKGIGWLTFERSVDAKGEHPRQVITARTSAGKVRWRWDVAATTPDATDVEVTSLYGDLDGSSYGAASCVGPDPAAPTTRRATPCTLRLSAKGKLEWIVPDGELAPSVYAEVIAREFGGVAEKTRFSWSGLDVGTVSGARLAVGLATP